MSTRPTTAPARNAPRIVSRPSCAASATKPTSSSTAARTRISAVVSWSRVTAAASAHRPRHGEGGDRGQRRPAPRRGRAVRRGSRCRTRWSRRTGRAARSRRSRPPRPRRRRSGPAPPSSRPASLSTGTTSPSEVADRVTAISTGLRTQPSSVEPAADGQPEGQRDGVPEQRHAEHRAAQPVHVDLEARRGTGGRRARARRRSRPGGRPRPSRARWGRGRRRRRSRAPRRAPGRGVRSPGRSGATRAMRADDEQVGEPDLGHGSSWEE